MDYGKTNILPDRYYHIFNHANSDINLFKKEQDYQSFFKRYHRYMNGIFKTLAYCLMPNHYHLCVKVETEDVILAKKKNKEYTAEQIVSYQLKNFLLSYSKYYQMVHETKGNIFQQKTKRIELSEPDYLFNLIGYIHLNPAHHGYVDKPQEWRYSSYGAYINRSKQTRVDVGKVLKLYGNEKNFKAHHNELSRKKYAEKMELKY